MQEIAAVKKQLLSQNYKIDGQQQQLRNIKVRLGQPLKISGDLISTRMPAPEMIAQIEQHLSKKLERSVTVAFTVKLVTKNHFKE
jgi:hypothetical protein